MLLLRSKIIKFLGGEHHSGLETRFIIGVLLPPFIVLVLLSVIVLWRLDGVVKNQAYSQLSRSATTTAAKLEREFAIRQSVLKQTGEELFSIRQNYENKKQQLENDRITCRTYVKQQHTFNNVPGNACDPFLTSFAREGVSWNAVEDGYVQQGPQLQQAEQNDIKQRLDAYSQFFPETSAIIVLDSNGNYVSSAFQGSMNDNDSVLAKIAQGALKNPVQGKTINKTIQDAKTGNGSNYRLAIFAYPISKGSVLAAYNLDNDSFLKTTWQSTPIDRHQSFAAILDAEGNLAYPNLNIGNPFTSQVNNLRRQQHVDMKIKNTANIVTAGEAGPSKWLVAVAAPTTAVLAPVRDAQLAAVLVIGIFLIGFLWVGTYYIIKRAVSSILGLAGGALVFASGKLDYKITLKDPAQEFQQLADTMNNMASRIARAEKEIDEKNKEFISVATHELRTPLTAILGNLSMAYEDMGDKLDASIKPIIGQAHAGTLRLRDLVNDMLDVARLEGGRTEFQMVPTDIKDITASAVESLAVVAKEKAVTLIYNQEGAARVMADEPHLRIILNNFISNAIKYNRPNGTVTVTHALKEGQLVTAIADTGLGIPEDQKAHIFEKFFRVTHEDRKNIVGTGLGMYITRQYILAMGGNVWFESTQGQGTTFYFTLPLAITGIENPAAAQTGGPAAKLEPAMAAAPTGPSQSSNAAVVGLITDEPFEKKRTLKHIFSRFALPRFFKKN